MRKSGEKNINKNSSQRRSLISMTVIKVLHFIFLLSVKNTEKAKDCFKRNGTKCSHLSKFKPHEATKTRHSGPTRKEYREPEKYLERGKAFRERKEIQREEEKLGKEGKRIRDIMKCTVTELGRSLSPLPVTHPACGTALSD